MAVEVEMWWGLPAGLICLAAMLLLLLLLLLAKKNHPTPKDLTLSTSGEMGKPSSNQQRRLVLEILMSSGRTESFRLKLEADAANFTALTNLPSSLSSAAKGCPCAHSGGEEEEEEEEAGVPGVPGALQKADSVSSHVTFSGTENNVPDAEAEEGSYGDLEAVAKMCSDDVAVLQGAGCESDWADGKAEKKRKRRRRRRKKKSGGERGVRDGEGRRRRRGRVRVHMRQVEGWGLPRGELPLSIHLLRQRQRDTEEN